MPNSEAARHSRQKFASVPLKKRERCRPASAEKANTTVVNSAGNILGIYSGFGPGYGHRFACALRFLRAIFRSCCQAADSRSDNLTPARVFARSRPVQTFSPLPERKLAFSKQCGGPPLVGGRDSSFCLEVFRIVSRVSGFTWASNPCSDGNTGLRVLHRDQLPSTSCGPGAPSGAPKLQRS